MNTLFRRKKRKGSRKKRRHRNIHLHETYTDSVIASEDFSVRDGEGRLQRSISVGQLSRLGFVFITCIVLLVFRIGYLQIARGEHHLFISENNTFDRVIVLPVRGVLYDRNGTPLAWNTGDADDEVPERTYHGEGFSSLLGFIRYPQWDTSGNYYRQKTEGESGLEEKYDASLAGESGSIVLEKNATGQVVSELYIEKPIDGDDVMISIDVGIQRALYKAIKTTAERDMFQGGSGVLMDVTNGEIIALVSYPDFDNNVLVDQSEKVSQEYVEGQGKDGIFVNRAVSGLYSPGSTIKPYFAVAALEEDIVLPHHIITSTGSITVQNPYNPDIVYVYKDWREHGDLTLYDAIAWSSNVYFYYIGGGYEHIDGGLGIDRLNFYAEIFGFGQPTNLGIFYEPSGLIPNPEWKRDRYNEEWVIGDTYNTVIGQYAFQVTPLQLARATSAIANGGLVIEPHLDKDGVPHKTRLTLSGANLRVAQEGMRRAVTEGSARSLNTAAYTIAAKTGTAQVGSSGIINSLMTGFFPYNNPRYAFVIIMERGEERAGAIRATRSFFDTLVDVKPEYLLSAN